MTYHIGNLSTYETHKATVENGFFMIDQNPNLIGIVNIEHLKEYNLHIVKFMFTVPYSYRHIEAQTLRQTINEMVAELGYTKGADDTIVEIHVTTGTVRENRKNLTREHIRERNEYMRKIGFGRKAVMVSNQTGNLDRTIYAEYSDHCQ